MLIEGRTLFPLSLLRPGFDGYYMSAEGSIFSNRGPAGKLKQLNGSRTISGHYFTLNNSTWRHDRIFAEAKVHAKFRAHTTGLTSEDLALRDAVVQTAEALNNHLLDRSHASSLEAGIKGRGTLLATVVNGQLVFGSKPKLHLTDKSWRDEAERIARLRPGLKVVALKVVASVVSEGVHWE